MDINHNLILGCNLCDIFYHIDKYDLIYPKSIDKVNDVDYIIIKCIECNKYILILRDHTEYITNEMFGRILYSAKKIFNNAIRIDTIVKHCNDHFHCHIDVK